MNRNWAVILRRLAMGLLVLAASCSDPVSPDTVVSGYLSPGVFGFVYEGQTWTFTATFRTAGGQLVQREVTWASSRPDIISIDPVTGTATAHQEGSAVLSADAGGVVAELEVPFDPSWEVVWQGPLRIERLQDFARIHGYTRITGDLIIEGGSIENVDRLEMLWQVDGDVSIQRNGRLENLTGLRNLLRVGGDIRVIRNEALTEFAGGFDRLRHVGGHIQLSTLEALVDLGESFGDLQTIEGGINFGYYPALETFSGFRSLESAGGLVMQGATLPDAPGLFPVLEFTRGMLFTHGAVENLVFPALRVVPNSIYISPGLRRDEHVRSLSFPVLECVGRTIRIGQLDHLEMPLLERVGDQCPPYHMENPASGIEICHSRDLEVLALPSLEVTSGLLVCDNEALREIDVPGVRRLGSHLAVDNNPLLERIRLPAAEEVGDLGIRGSPIHELEMAELQLIGSRLLVSDSRLEEVSFPALEILGSIANPTDGIQIHQNPDLARIELPSLRETGRIQVAFNPALVALSLPSLIRAGDLNLLMLPALGALELGSLVEARWLQVESAPALETLTRLGSLVSLSNGLTIQDNLALHTLELPVLAEIAAFLSIINNPVLTDLEGLAAVRSPVVNLDIQGNLALESLAPLEGLGDATGGPHAVEGDLWIRGNASLPDAVVEAFVEHLRTKFGGTDGIGGLVHLGGNGG